ncbi:MAG: hypothetical protein JWR67_33 [Mucilaginibacter sp.]|nr:hypothetical protein [Mucilaginibacter sp.]
MMVQATVSTPINIFSNFSICASGGTPYFIKRIKDTLIVLFCLAIVIIIFLFLFKKKVKFVDTSAMSAFEYVPKASHAIKSTTTVFKIDTLYVKFNYKNTAELWLELSNGKEFHADEVSADELAGILAIINTGKAQFNTGNGELILDMPTK